MQNPLNCLYFVGQGILSVFGLRSNHQPTNAIENLEHDAGQLIGKGIKTAYDIATTPYNPTSGIATATEVMDLVETAGHFAEDCVTVGQGYQLIDDM